MLFPISTALYAFTEESDVMPVSIFRNSVPSQKGFLSVKNDKNVCESL